MESTAAFALIPLPDEVARTRRSRAAGIELLQVDVELAWFL